MVDVLYTFEYPFMQKTFAAIDRHLDAESAYLPLAPEAVGSWDGKRTVDDPPDGVPAFDAAVRDADPGVLVENHRNQSEQRSSTDEYPLVHVRHGASIGRGEKWNTTRDLAGVVDLALAPGEYWARHYRDEFPDDVDVSVVGVPEADALVADDAPRERRVLYAPTNHNFGGGCYVETAEHVLDVVAGSRYELLFRPHPHDRTQEPGRTVTERCRERIAGLENATFDDRETPMASMREADVLVSDYSGIVTEWLHTGRPLVQLTDVAADREVPAIGATTDRLSPGLLDELYEDGRPPEVQRRREAWLSKLGIPMDGAAGERAAGAVSARVP